MIRHIQGEVIEKNNGYVVLQTSSGIGYGVLLSEKSDLWNETEVGSDVSFYTSHQFRENEQNLYGFLSMEERNFFEQLITVSGVGPKLAATLLAHLDRKDLAEMIVNEDVAGITAVPGIGKKMAERVIVDLRDRVLGEVGAERKVKSGDHAEEIEFLVQALERLGFSTKEREEMLDDVEELFESESSVEGVLKLMLADTES